MRLIPIILFASICFAEIIYIDNLEISEDYFYTDYTSGCNNGMLTFNGGGNIVFRACGWCDSVDIYSSYPIHLTDDSELNFELNLTTGVDYFNYGVDYRLPDETDWTNLYSSGELCQNYDCPPTLPQFIQIGEMIEDINSMYYFKISIYNICGNGGNQGFYAYLNDVTLSELYYSNDLSDNVYFGCTDISASNYNENANYDDGSCNYLGYGCTDIYADNYDSQALTDNGNCEYSIQISENYFYSDYVADCNNNNILSIDNGGNITFGACGWCDSVDIYSSYPIHLTDDSELNFELNLTTGVDYFNYGVDYRLPDETDWTNLYSSGELCQNYDCPSIWPQSIQIGEMIQQNDLYYFKISIYNICGNGGNQGFYAYLNNVTFNDSFFTYGCTNPYSNNYIENAYIDDETCLSAKIIVPNDFETIQSAINYSEDGDTVFVHAGTYYENINFNGKDIYVTGEDRETTIIDGNLSSSVVKFINSESKLENFTISNGNGNEQGSGFVENCDYPYCGGGITIHNSSPQINNCLITNNTSSRGGGIYCTSTGSGSPIISNSIIRNNIVDIEGGGIAIMGNGWSGFVNNCIIEYNVANNGTNQENGGGIFLQDSYYTISRTLIKNNWAGRGGGIGIQSGSYFNATFDKLTIIDNESTYGDGINLYHNGWMQNINLISNSIVRDEITIENGGNPYDTIVINYSNFNNIYLHNTPYDVLGIGNFNMDPQFTDPDNVNFTLQPTSPCIDSGDPDSPLDPDGTRADMGAYYYHQTFIGDLNGDAITNVSDIVLLVELVLSISAGNEPTDEQLQLGDIYPDGQLNVIDIVALVNIILDQ